MQKELIERDKMSRDINESGYHNPKGKRLLKRYSRKAVRRANKLKLNEGN